MTAKTRNILIFFFLSLISVYGSKPVVLTDSLDEICISREYVKYLEDPKGMMTIGEILSLGDKNNRFIPSTAQDLINENIKSAYWLKFKVQNNSQSLKPFRIELFDFDIDEISFYYPDTTGKYIEQKAGYDIPFSHRELGHKNVSFRIPVHISPTDNLYMRFYSNKRNVLEPMVRSYDRTLNYALNEYILFGIFYGLLLLIIFYNFLYFIFLRKPYYFYYVVYGCGMLIYLISRNGIGFQYLWQNFPEINDYTGETGVFISTLAMLLFTNSFLSLRTKAQKYYNIIFSGILIRILLYGIQLGYPHYYLFELFDLIYLQAVFFITFKVYKEIPTAKWLIISFTILNLSFLITVLEQSSIISSSIITVYSVNVGIILQFVALSIGIAESVKEVYKEKSKVQTSLIIQYQQNERLREKVNRELEEKVKARTLELDKANEELKRKAEENVKMNIALDLANNELKKNINSFAQSSVTKEYLDFEEFKKAYSDEFSCISYLRDLKEKQGFICIKCGNTKSIKGKAKFDVRCSKCNYNESLTANTIFHRTKFSLQKAFYMLYIISKKEDIPAAELSRILDLQNATCQNFKNKVIKRLKERKKTSKQKDLSWDFVILDKKPFTGNPISDKSQLSYN